jgi:signal transduction histidine kinase
MYPKEKQEIVRNRLKSLSKTNPVSTFQYEKMLPSGEIRWEEWTYRAIFDRDGKVKEIQSVGKDITERKKAEQLLLKERNRAEFFTDLMSHDINNLNHGIFSYLNIILRDENLPEQTKIRLKTCLHLSEEISNLIDKVRLLSDIDDISLELKPINITKLMENVIKTVSINSPRKIVMIDYDFKNKDIIVKANELLETVIYNILNNAIKHNDKKDVKINITHMYSKYTRFYRFEFHDNGPGIEDEMKGKIFNRMVRAGNDKRVHGFGLGLTLVKNIIEKFGGKIWVEDNVFGDPSQGSNFVVLLQAI